MLDRYWSGGTSRISPEAPVPVVRVDLDEGRAGGAANVASNIAALGASVDLIGVTGADEAAQLLQQQLQQVGVGCHLEATAAATITKLRVVSHQQQLLRLDFEPDPKQFHRPQLSHQIATALEAKRYDVVVLSDYGKGVLHDPQPLIAAARAAAVPVLVDPKGRDFSRYRGATLITPNLAEFEAVVGHCRDETELLVRGEQLREALALEALLITRGGEGMTLIQAHRAPLHQPTRAREVYDVTGAGDTVIAVLAAAYAAGEDLAAAVTLANLAAGIVVGKLGTATVTADELRQALPPSQRDVSQQPHGVVTEAQLQQQLEAARRRGERVVMTNGCFDLLHAGHVRYLQQAAALGDRLVVAVNDDASVRQLKGASRPINPLAERMAVLAGLASVDWVVPFSEQTPQRLICRLLPDLLVKGGDYQPEQIAGGECVVAAGGEVVVLDFLEGCSTSAIVARMTAT